MYTRNIATKIPHITDHISLDSETPTDFNEGPVCNQKYEQTSKYKYIHVTRTLVLYVCFVDNCFFCCTLSFDFVFSVLLRYTILITPLVLQTLLSGHRHTGLI